MTAETRLTDPSLIRISTTVNNTHRTLEVEARETLAEMLRDRLGLTGTKLSCGLQICGACTVLLDGRSVSACTILALEADGRSLRTVEGLVDDGQLHPLQQAFLEHGAFQCGFCTPGFLMTALELLERNPSPDEQIVREGLAGNICRCTGYRTIVEATVAAGKAMSAGTGLNHDG